MGSVWHRYVDFGQRQAGRPVVFMERIPTRFKDHLIAEAQGISLLFPNGAFTTYIHNKGMSPAIHRFGQSLSAALAPRS
jgi:hypothetical protein